MEDCVILSEKGVLDQDLDTKYVGEDRECSGNYRRKSLSEMIISDFESLKEVC